MQTAHISQPAGEAGLTQTHGPKTQGAPGPGAGQSARARGLPGAKVGGDRLSHR
jgi:hypothetical protein